MSSFSEKAISADYRKILKRLIVIAICVIIAGGGLSAFTLRTQISEIIQYEQQTQQSSGGSSQSTVSERDHHDEGGLFGDLENAGITQPGTAAKITVSVTLILAFLTAIAFWLYIASWLYKEARRSKMNGPLWFVCGLVGTVITIAVFEIVRGFIRKQCPECAAYQLNNAEYCTDCGAAFMKTCPECGQTCGTNEKFCHSCGKRLDR
ncbi:MAG: zinc ribbon domain-containing protein [Anaerovoracaceae bacterium]|jgi:hypothetical protein